MFYRVRADMAFREEDEAKDFFHDCKIALPKGDVINSGQENEERGYCSLERCYHDEPSPHPCELVEIQEAEE